MTVTTSVAPLINLDAPAPRPPLFGLLGSPDAATPAPARDHWQAGARVERWPSEMPSTIDPCQVGTFRDKGEPEASGFTEEGFLGFTAYLGDICTAFAIGDWTKFQNQANTALEVRTSWALERQLAWATYAAAEHFLADGTMQTPAGTSATPALNAIAYLDDWLSQFGQRGVISITPSVATFLGFEKLRVDGQQVRTAAGTPVIIGQGYADPTGQDNLDPTGTGAEAAPGASWIFAHPQVMYQTGPVIPLPGPLAQAIDTHDNTVVYRAERDLWVGFDGGDHAGALADWTP